MDLLSQGPALGGKDTADLALAGVGWIAVVRFYRYVDDVEAFELTGERGWQRVGGSSIVGQHPQGIHALAVSVDQPHLSVAIRAGRRIDLHPQLRTPPITKELGGTLPGLSRQRLKRSARGDLDPVADDDGGDAGADDETEHRRGGHQKP